jgi:putative FmdB family regulatory protein
MPLFEYECAKCHRSFEKLVRSNEAVISQACPSCGSHKTKKRVSAFAHAVKGGSSAPKSSASGGCSGGCSGGNCGGCKGCGGH